MNYDTESTFFQLMDAVAAEGGEHLDAVCTMRRYELIGHDPKVMKALKIPRPIKVNRNGPIPGCGQSALFHIPYEGPDREVGVMGMTVCAVEDAAGAFPRFGGDKLAKLSTKELFFVHGDALEKDDPRVTGK